MRTLARRKSVDALAIGPHAEDMEVRLHASVEEFRAVAEPLYRRDPVAHTIELTVLQGGDLPEGSILLSVWRDGQAVGAAMRTPPYPLACNGIPADAMEGVAAELARIEPGLNGVSGMRESVVAFADTWRAATRQACTVTSAERLYRLGTLSKPNGVAGSHRLASDDDRGLLVDWVERFFVETFEHQRNDTAGEEFVDAAARKGDRFVLWVVDGVPVSTAMLRAPAAGVSRIGPVFTPRDQRAHGYGSAVTAAAADLAFSNGVHDVVLFADLANPTSNAIYQRIGFEPVADSVRIGFGTLD
jgi:RimJ/RimL family protein N-acetyltransferase